MKSIKITIVISCMFLTTQAFSQWTEIALPFRSPENKFVSIGDKYFTYQTAGGIYKSTDKGHNWTRANNGISSTFEIRDLISFQDTLVVSTFNEGVYMSSDLGESWKAMGNLPKDAYNDFAVHNDKLFTINRNGLIFEKERGSTNWAQTSDPEAWNNNSGENRWIFSNDRNLLFAIGEGQLHQSADDGKSWIQVNLAKGLYPLSLVYDIAIKDNAIWIATVDQDYTPILLYSLDFGMNWKVKDIAGGFHVQSVAISDLYIGYILSGTIYYSSNNGESWNSKYVSGDKIVNLNSDEFLVTSSSGVKTFDASDTSVADFEINGITGYNLANVEFTENEIFILTDDLIAIDKVSESLTKIPKPNGQLTNVQDIAALQGNLYGQFNNKVYRYNFENKSWNATFVNVDNIYNLAAGQSRLFARSPAGFYFAESGSNVLTRTNITSDGLIHSVFENDTLTIINSSDELLISNDGAVTWESKDPDEFAAYYFSTAVTKSKIFTCTTNGLFVSADAGKTWNKIESALINQPQALLYHDGRLYLGTKDAILVSPDEGLHWFSKKKNINYYFPTKNLYADKTHLYNNTAGGGIWRIPLIDLYDAPVIEAIVGDKLEYELGKDIVLKLENLVVKDSDNTFPTDFHLVILEGEKYEIEDKETITLTNPDIRELKVNVQVTDGTALSNIFAIPIVIFEPLGIAEYTNENKKLVYPNPTKSFLYFKVKSNDTFTIYVYDLAGRIVHHTNQHAINSTIKLDVTNLPEGEYIVTINHEDYVVKQKIIKN